MPFIATLIPRQPQGSSSCASSVMRSLRVKPPRFLNLVRDARHRRTRAQQIVELAVEDVRVPVHESAAAKRAWWRQNACLDQVVQCCEQHGEYARAILACDWHKGQHCHRSSFRAIDKVAAYHTIFGPVAASPCISCAQSISS